MENKKYLIVSDIHGSMLALDETISIANDLKVDKIVILGDTFGSDANEMVEKLNSIYTKLDIIRGNNDWYFEPENAKFDFRDNLYINLNGTLAFACHGHRLDDMNLHLYGAKIIMQGHVHRPFIEARDGIIRFCPGSIARPRFGSSKSFAVVENKKIQIFSTNFELIDEISFT